ncbi:hypothetical protein [Streptomyces sp. NPDC054961]
MRPSSTAARIADRVTVRTVGGKRHRMARTSEMSHMFISVRPSPASAVSGGSLAPTAYGALAAAPTAPAASAALTGGGPTGAALTVPSAGGGGLVPAAGSGTVPVARRRRA